MDSMVAKQIHAVGYKEGWDDAYATLVQICGLTDLLKNKLTLKDFDLFYRTFCRAASLKDVMLDAPSELSAYEQWKFHEEICNATNPNPNLIKDCSYVESHGEGNLCLIGERLYREWKKR